MSAGEIQLKSVSKVYSGASQVSVLNNLTLSIARGERVAIVGKSGSGKSTLLNILAGLDRPTSGAVFVDGRALHALSSNEMAKYRLQSVGVIFQAFQLIPQRKAIENVELPLILAGVASADRRSRARHWLEQVGLQHRLDHYPYQLSGGEQQRVAIARALIHAPGFLLADEPTGSLDSSTSVEIVDLLIRLCEEVSATFVLVTHDMTVADRLCKRTLTMVDGGIAERLP